MKISTRGTTNIVQPQHRSNLHTWPAYHDHSVGNLLLGSQDVSSPTFSLQNLWLWNMSTIFSFNNHLKDPKRIKSLPESISSMKKSLVSRCWSHGFWKRRRQSSKTTTTTTTYKPTLPAWVFGPTSPPSQKRIQVSPSVRPKWSTRPGVPDLSKHTVWWTTSSRIFQEKKQRSP